MTLKSGGLKMKFSTLMTSMALSQFLKIEKLLFKGFFLPPTELLLTPWQERKSSPYASIINKSVFLKIQLRKSAGIMRFIIKNNVALLNINHCSIQYRIA
jgi:hypothetical protein